MTRCSAWKPIPRFCGMSSCGAAMPAGARAARNYWSAVFESTPFRHSRAAFAANALYLEVIRLAYNLVTALQRTRLPKEWKRTKETFTKIDRLLQRISEKMRDFRPKSQKEAATHAGFKYHSRYWVLGTRYFFVPNFRLKSLAINFPWKRPFSMKISLVIEPATITPAT